MSERTEAWAAELELTLEQASEFRRLVGELESTPVEILRTMIDRVLWMDKEVRRYGSPGLAHWVSGKEKAEIAAEYAVDALPLDIRPTSFMWPADKPFPWSPEECLAAVIGYEVKWKGAFDDFMTHLRGKWEMSDGYAVLHQS